MTDEQTDEKTMSSSAMWTATLASIVAAAAPHAFFAPPLQLHMAGEMQQWLGLAVWTPAILAGVAFFFGVEFTARFERDKIPGNAAVAIVLVLLIAHMLFLASVFEKLWTDMGSLTPWGELAKAMPLFAVLGAMQALFFQGFVQRRVLENVVPRLRVPIVALLGATVFVPYMATAPAAAPLLLTVYFFEGLLVALAFEGGFPVWAAMILRAVCGAAFVWFQQAMLL
jgi:hypothetical protein